MEASLWTSLGYWFTPTALFVLLNLVIGTIALTSKSNPSRTKEDFDRRVQLSQSPSVLQRLRSFDLNLYSHQPQDDDDNSSSSSSCSEQYQEAPVISRQPSFLQRLRSIGLYRGDSVELQDDTTTNYNDNDNSVQHQAPMVYRQPSFLQRMRSIRLYREEVPPRDERQARASGEPIEARDEEHHINRSKSESTPAKRATRKKMRKSASEKAALGSFEAEEFRRPTTVREGKGRSRLVHGAEEGEEEEEGGEVDARADDFINRFRQQLKLQRLDSILRYTEMLKRGN